MSIIVNGHSEGKSGSGNPGILNPVDAWVLRRVLTGHELNGEAEILSDARLRKLASVLSEQESEEARAILWEGFLLSFPDPDAVVSSLGNIDPDGPMPEVVPKRFATVEDLVRIQSGIRWLWPGWLPSSTIIGIAGAEGTGKSRFCMDICKRMYLGLPWPDGQEMTLPAGSRSLWMCADGNHDELPEVMASYGLPEGCIILPAPPDDPYAGVSLDSPEDMELLEDAIATEKPAMVFIDTLTNATGRDLCEQRSMKALKTPLLRLCKTYGIPIVLLLHVNLQGQALGRRVKGITRTLIHLAEPDPEEQPGRLKLWVEKSYDKKPPALGVTMSDEGNTYDFNPPFKPDAERKAGRPDGERQKIQQFVRDALAEQNDRIGNELQRECEAKGLGSRQTFWRAVEDMEKGGDITIDGGKGKGRQKVLHLTHDEDGADEWDQPY